MRAYVALGSNQGNPQVRVLAAFDALDALPGTQVLRRSFLYRTPPWGVTEQPDFINAAAELDTDLPPEALLQALQVIEKAAGRKRDGERWGPRTLDLDLLVYADCEIDQPGLTLPHPRIAERAFVLLPLSDIAPDLVIPGRGRVSTLLRDVDTGTCKRLPAAT